VALASIADEELARPAVPDLSHTGESVLVTIPANIGEIMEVDAELASAWRAATRSAFVHYLARGYEVRDFLRGSKTSRYVLALRDDDVPTETPTT